MTKPYYLMPDDENYISKSDLKKEAKELQAFATELCKLSKNQRAELTASDELQEAFLLADKISNKPDALRRHFQYMAKVLRDEDLDALRAEHERFVNPNAGPDKRTQELEVWRDKLIKHGDSAINELLSENPALDRQKLRQLVRQAKKELEKEKPAKNFKELFQYIKSGMEG